MAYYIVNKSSLSGELSVPPSKSHTLRAILFAGLASGTSIIHNYLNSNDTSSMIEACKSMGALVSADSGKLAITGTDGQVLFLKPLTRIDAGNSGIVLRFCSAIGALACSSLMVTGDQSIRSQRPMQPMIDALHQLNVSISSLGDNGYAPLLIQGPIRPGKVRVQGEDSQFVSALLIALAFAKGPSTLLVEKPGEKPWVALTLDWFDRLGISYKNSHFDRFEIAGNTSLKAFAYTIPGDLSSAAFPIAAALITDSELVIQNIDLQDAQGDKELVAILQAMGADIRIDPIHKTLIVKQGSKLKGLEVDINNCIDAITILSVIGCYAQGETRIRNAAIARSKECDRIACIAQELSKMGAQISETADGLSIKESKLMGASLFSHHDHRMAMSLAVAAMGASGTSQIHESRCVAKTFPSFLHDFRKIGAKIEEHL